MHTHEASGANIQTLMKFLSLKRIYRQTIILILIYLFHCTVTFTVMLREEILRVTWQDKERAAQHPSYTKIG